MIATDASEAGYGVFARECAADRVRSLGSTSDRWCCDIEDAVHARNRALLAALETNAVLEPRASRVRWRLLFSLSEVGDDVFYFSKWHVLFAGKCWHTFGIIRTEGLAVLWVL